MHSLQHKQMQQARAWMPFSVVQLAQELNIVCEHVQVKMSHLNHLAGDKAKLLVLVKREVVYLATSLVVVCAPDELFGGLKLSLVL